MHDFLLKEIFSNDICSELSDIGYDSSYVFKGREKFEYKNIKIFDITSTQGNIIKQLALSVGADCATNKQVITGKIEHSDCILGGNISQLRVISDKLKHQPFGLKDLGTKLGEYINLSYSTNKTKIMGILNVTKNSFSDGGDFYNFDDSIKHLNELIIDGADIIDIGAESTKPGALAVEDKLQLEKLVPILEYIKREKLDVPISIDTRSSVVAKKCIELGASIINDVSGFDYDNNMVEVIAQNPNVKIIIQHSKGLPENMQNDPHYDNLADEIFINLKNKVDIALKKGILKENIIIDPGIGFGKTRDNNFEIIKRWKELKTIGCPVLIGLSRKSLLNMPDASNDKKDLYTLALNSILINEKIDYIRVHNVKIHKNLLDLLN